MPALTSHRSEPHHIPDHLPKWRSYGAHPLCPECPGEGQASYLLAHRGKAVDKPGSCGVYILMQGQMLSRGVQTVREIVKEA